MINRRTVLAVAGTSLFSSMFANVTQAADFKVGLLTQGAATEEGWNRSAYDALQRIGNELGAEVSNVELDDNPASYVTAFRNYANRGFGVLIGHGFQFEDAAREVAPEFPDTNFLITSSEVFEKNLIGVNIDLYQPLFVIGALAAMRSDKAGFIGGVEVPPIMQAAVGFANGARYIKPNMEVLQVMTGSWSDLATAKEAALAMIASGAEFIVPAANVSSLGALQAISEKGADVKAFGIYGDHTERAPKSILGNFDPDLGQAIVAVFKQIKGGTFNPTSNIVFGLEARDVERLSFSSKAEHPVTPEEMAKLEEIIAKLVSGEIDPSKG